MQEHENVVTGKKPLNMVVIPPRRYCIIENPVKIKDHDVVFNQYGEAEVRHGEVEIRFHEQYPEPFPLYFREKMVGNVRELTIVEEN